MEKGYVKNKKWLKQTSTSSNGGITSQLIAITPLMQRKIEEQKKLFGNKIENKSIHKKELSQLANRNHGHIVYLRVKNLIYMDKEDNILHRKIDYTEIWTKILKNYPKGKIDYASVAKEIAMEYLRKHEEYVDVEWDTYSQKS